MLDTDSALLEEWLKRSIDHDSRVPPPPSEPEPENQPGAGGGSPWGWRETLAVATVVAAGPAGWIIGSIL
jgi:hypothetical protein